MIKNMQDAEKDAVLMVADLMCAAARTAPKGSGKDTIRTAIVTGEDKDKLSEAMKEEAREFNLVNINRDAGNVDKSTAVVLIGCINKPFGFSGCGLCGHESCASNINNGGRCAFNITDLGIAVGSAVSLAMDNRIDNRVMYTIGRVAKKMGMMSEDVGIIYGIPLSVSEKSPFFDRGPGAVIEVK